MANTENVTTDQEQAIEAASALIQETHEKVSGALGNYVNSNVTCSVTVGPEGGSMQGNIHYTSTPDQIYFAMEGKPSEFYGLFAGAGFGILVGSLAPERVVGQAGTFVASGSVFGGLLQLWVGGQPVFKDPIWIPGGGSPSWKLAGRVRFSRVS